MTSMHSRRRFVSSLTGLGAALAAGPSLAGLRQLAAQEDPAWSGGLGLTRAEFENIVGSGTLVDEFVRYDDPLYRNGAIHALYDGDVLTFMEIDVSETSSGGVIQEAARDHGRSLAPTYSDDPLARYVLGFHATMTDVFDIRVGTSEDLADVSGSSGYVVSLETPSGGDALEAPRTQRIALATERSRPPAVTPAGEPRGLGRPHSEWIDEYGDITVAQAGVTYPVPDFDGGVLVIHNHPDDGVSSLQGISEEGMSLDTALTLIGGWLPADAIREADFLLRPTPGGPLAVSIQTWNLPSLDTHAAVLLYEGGERETTTVSRVTMTLESVDDTP